MLCVVGLVARPAALRVSVRAASMWALGAVAVSRPVSADLRLLSQREPCVGCQPLF